MLGPYSRKLALLAHIVCSVAWIGAVAAFLTLALVGLRSLDPLAVQSAYLAMEPVTWFVIVPLSFVSLFTGLLLSLGTQWGLFRHYWVLIKFIINVLSIAILLMHTRIIHQVAVAATHMAFTDLYAARVKLMVVSLAALLALLLATGLSVYKPRGLTSYGWRERQSGVSNKSTKT